MGAPLPGRWGREGGALSSKAPELGAAGSEIGALPGGGRTKGRDGGSRRPARRSEPIWGAAASGDPVYMVTV